MVRPYGCANMVRQYGAPIWMCHMIGESVSVMLSAAGASNVYLGQVWPRYTERIWHTKCKNGSRHTWIDGHCT